MAETPEAVVDSHCHTGEGPLWHPDQKVLYWIDIPRGELFAYDPQTGDHDRRLDYDGTIGGFTIQADGSLLLFLDRATVRPWSTAGGLGDPVVAPRDDEGDSRFNDVIADPRGRVYCGTMPTDDRDGRLYRLDRDGTLTRLFDDVGLPNGLGFTPNRRHLYFADTGDDRIYRFGYEQATGALENRRVLVDTADVSGHPDGLTVDTEGYLWVAFWNGGRLVRYAPDGTEVERVEFPARKVSSVTFGKPNYDRAFVTTALGPGEGPAGDRADEGEGAGELFTFEPNVGGVPEFRSRVNM